MSSTPTEWSDFQSASENTKAVRKTLGAVLALAPENAPVPGSLVDPTGRQVMSLPEAYWPVGLLTPEGISHEREVETGAVDALGHFSPVREDIDSAVRRVTFRGYELHRANIVALSEGVSPLSLPPVEDYQVKVALPSRPLQRFYRCIAISFDGNLDSPWFDAYFYPRVSVTSFPSDTWARGEARSYEIGLTAYEDSALGYDKSTTFAGLGFANNAEDLGWTVAYEVWTATTAYVLGNRVELASGAVLECATAGTSGSTAPTAPGSVGGTVTDGTAVWTLIKAA